MTNAAPTDFASMMNEHLGGWNRAMGLRFVKATQDEVVAEIDVSDAHLQPYGILHGGVHTGIIETVCSTGAALAAQADGRTVVGLENATSFLRAVRGGKLRVTALPRARGRRSQVWEATVCDETGRAVATGRVRLICLEAGSEIAGEKVEVKA
jgi:1,4-dihydroxy-2-naphthoyl-CoA hydrolase